MPDRPATFAVYVRLTPEEHDALNDLKQRGRSRSAVVDDAIKLFLARHPLTEGVLIPPAVNGKHLHRFDVDASVEPQLRAAKDTYGYAWQDILRAAIFSYLHHRT